MTSEPNREIMEMDVCIVGAGPAGLAAAIRLAQANAGLSICVLEKAGALGAHTLSGAVLEPAALTRLLPNWQAESAPLSVQVSADSFYFLTKKSAVKLPTPPPMKNQGNYIISLGALVQWLGAQAEALGVQLFTGFAAQSAIIENGHVKGVITGDMGIGKNGARKENFQAGVEIRAKYTLFAEGARGHISEQLKTTLGLWKPGQFQTYALGIKEVWEVPQENHKQGEVLHTIGWPLDGATYGGSFIYHGSNRQIALGLVVGLDYANPYLSPFEEFQRFKTHPKIAALLKGGKRISYGARVLNEGGLQSIPTLSFPGGALIGCAAGFVNVPKIKGIHNALDSGRLAAEAVLEAFKAGTATPKVDEKITRSNIFSELKRVRNIRPYFRFGLLAGVYFSALDTLLGGRVPWTLEHHKPDHTHLKPKEACKKIVYPAPDGVLTFDRLSSVFLSGTNHEEDQPVHLRLRDSSVPIVHNLAKFDAPETRYCPAGVYEIQNNTLVINAQNCLHCKACDVKDPTQNIHWVTPEGGGGPNYAGM